MRSIFRLWTAFGIILLILAADALDSFGMASASDARGARVTGRMLAPFYDAGDKPARDAISVVLISDATLEAFEIGPPPTYQLQADLIFRLAEARPAGIFFDFVYNHPRETPDAIAYLGAAIDHAASLGVPVITGPRADKPAFAPLKAAGMADVGWRSERESDYPFLGASERATAAAALYDLICRARPGLACAPQLLDATWRSRLPAISVQWGGRAAPGLDAYWAADDVAACSSNARDRLAQTAAVVLRELARGALGSAEDRGNGCFYHLTAPAHVLLGLDQDAINRFAAGRVVLVGSAYSGSADEVVAPGYGRIPGVMQHAMALDNLLVFHDSYRRWPGAILWQLDLDDLLEGVLAMVLLWIGAVTLNRVVAQADALDGSLSVLGRLPPEVPSDSWFKHVVAPAAALFGFLGLVLLVPLICAAFASMGLNWPPANVLGVAGTVIAVGAVLARRDRITQLLQPEILRAVGFGLILMAATLALFAPVLLSRSASWSVWEALILVSAAIAVSIAVAAAGIIGSRPRTRR